MLTLVKPRQDTMTIGPEVTARCGGGLPVPGDDFRAGLFSVSRCLMRQDLESTPEVAQAFSFLAGQRPSSTVRVVRRFGGNSSWMADLDFWLTDTGAHFIAATWNVTGGIVFSPALIEDCAEANEPLNLEWQTSLHQTRQPKVSEAPAWLARRMATLRQMPPPTLQEVDTQLKASAEARRKLIAKQPASSNGRESETRS